MGRPKLGTAKEVPASTHLPSIVDKFLDNNRGIATKSAFIRAIIVGWYNQQPGNEAIPT